MNNTNVQLQIDNQNSVFTKYCSLILVFFTVILINNSAFSATEKQTNWLEKPISISFQNEPLSTVLKQISKKTGVSIAYDQELANEKVTGNYQNVKTSDAITRLFRSKNKSIQVNKAKKIIIVKTFGAKNFIWAGSNQSQSNSSQMSLAELEQMQSQQYRQYKKSISDDNEILDGGMTRREVRTMQKQQYAEYKKQIADESEVLEGGMTRGEIRARQEQQYKEYQKNISNNSEVITISNPGNSMTRGEIRAMQEQQYKEYQEDIANNKEALDIGMTRGELRTLHNKQFSQHKKWQENKSRLVNAPNND